MEENKGNQTNLWTQSRQNHEGSLGLPFLNHMLHFSPAVTVVKIKEGFPFGPLVGSKRYIYLLNLFEDVLWVQTGCVYSNPKRQERALPFGPLYSCWPQHASQEKVLHSFGEKTHTCTCPCKILKLEGSVVSTGSQALKTAPSVIAFTS